MPDQVECPICGPRYKWSTWTCTLCNDTNRCPTPDAAVYELVGDVAFLQRLRPEDWHD